MTRRAAAREVRRCPRPAPAHRYRHRTGRHPLDDLIEEVHPPLLIQRREVDDDVGARAQPGDDLDVHVDLSGLLEHLLAAARGEGHHLLLREHRNPEADLPTLRPPGAPAGVQNVTRSLAKYAPPNSAMATVWPSPSPAGEAVALRQVRGRQRALRERLGRPLVGRDPGTRRATRRWSRPNTPVTTSSRPAGISRLPSRPRNSLAVVAVDPQVRAGTWPASAPRCRGREGCASRVRGRAPPARSGAARTPPSPCRPGWPRSCVRAPPGSSTSPASPAVVPAPAP